MAGELLEHANTCGERQAVDEGGVGPGDRLKLGGQGEDDLEVGHGEHALQPPGQPGVGGRALTPWTVPVAAGVAGDARPATCIADAVVHTQLARAASEQVVEHALLGGIEPEARPTSVRVAPKVAPERLADGRGRGFKPDPAGAGRAVH